MNNLAGEKSEVRIQHASIASGNLSLIDSVNNQNKNKNFLKKKKLRPNNEAKNNGNNEAKNNGNNNKQVKSNNNSGEKTHQQHFENSEKKALHKSDKSKL